MQQSFVISSVGHVFFLYLIIFSGWTLNKPMEPAPVPVKVSVISISEFDAKVSTAPKAISKKTLIQPRSGEKVMTVPKFEIQTSKPIMINNSERIRLEVDDNNFIPTPELRPILIEEKNNFVNLKAPEELKTPSVDAMKEVKGNEQKSYDAPELAIPQRRTADRIDKVAVSKSSSQLVVEVPKKAIKLADDALEMKEISNAEAPKEASTKITPEGEKNVPIVVSGAVKMSLPPPSRPKIQGPDKTPPKKRPKASELLKNKTQTDQIEMLLAQLGSDQEQSVLELSLIEKNDMVSAITQKLAKYWEQGILAGNSNFEKYVVQVEVELNSLGEIIGGIKPLVPSTPKGPYLIAYRQASNALISAGTLPIIPDKFPNGITLTITFDPEKGFSF